MRVSRQQALAFRVAAQGLAERGEGDPLAALRMWAVQDSPPGTAAAALLARSHAEIPAGLEEHDDVVAMYNARTATALVPAADVAAYATAFLPADDAGRKAIVGPALRGRREGFAEPVASAVAAVAGALDGRVLSRDELHEELRARLPLDLLPWCPGCGSHHMRRGLLVMASLHGKLCIAGRAGRQPAFARTDQHVAWDPPARETAGAELVRRYLRGYGPSTPAMFAAWAGLAPKHARELWALVADELAEVEIEPPGGGRAWLLEADRDRLSDPPPARGVRLLASGDPLLLARDRELLITDEPARKRVWKAIGGAGVVLVDGEAAALWQARKRGKRLEVTVEAIAAAPKPPLEELQAEADRLARQRGCVEATITSG